MCLIKSKSEQFNLKWTRAPSEGCELSTFWMSKQARSMCTKSLKFKTKSDVPNTTFSAAIYQTLRTARFTSLFLCILFWGRVVEAEENIVIEIL